MFWLYPYEIYLQWGKLTTIEIKWTGYFLTQIDISNVSFSLFSYFIGLIFHSDSDLIKGFPFAHLLNRPKKYYLMWREHAYLFSIRVCKFLTLNQDF